MQQTPAPRGGTRTVSRRTLMRTAALLIPATLPAALWPGLAGAAVMQPRRLDFYHTHTSEKLAIVYAERGEYLPDALAEIDRFLRDFRTGHVHSIDTGLLDTLHLLRQATGGKKAYEIISGFRSPVTNEMLRGNGGGVAKRSLHMDGKAIDVRLPGVDTADLRAAALELKKGGVGYYPQSDFVHLDTGRVRFW